MVSVSMVLTTTLLEAMLAAFFFPVTRLKRRNHYMLKPVKSYLREFPDVHGKQTSDMTHKWPNYSMCRDDKTDV